MKSSFSLSLLLVLSLVFSACKKEEEVLVGVSTAQYNELVDKHNNLLAQRNEVVHQGWKSSNAYLTYSTANRELNAYLNTFSSESTRIYSARSSVSATEINSYTQLYQNGIRAILRAQASMIEHYNELVALAPSIYRDGEAYAETLADNRAVASSLDGLLAQHKALYDIVIASTQGEGQSNTREVPVSSRQIELTEVEQVITDIQSDGAISRNSAGELVVLEEREFLLEAQRRRFAPATARHALDMARSFNGISGMACTNSDLVQVMSDMVSHMKGQANTNTDDLEIVLAIDYSGSMSNNIQAVMNQLDRFLSSMENVHHSGRKIKYGIITFGEPGREKIDLALTENVSDVQTMLQTLLRLFHRNNHAIEPGEASYYALDKSTQMQWSSLNRQIILITDEPSYSLAIGDTSYISSVEARLSQTKLYPLIVRLCYTDW
jgi:hypothetical protein